MSPKAESPETPVLNGQLWAQLLGKQSEGGRQGIIRVECQSKSWETWCRFSVPALSYSVTLDKSLHFGGPPLHNLWSRCNLIGLLREWRELKYVRHSQLCWCSIRTQYTLLPSVRCSVRTGWFIITYFHKNNGASLPLHICSHKFHFSGHLAWWQFMDYPIPKMINNGKFWFSILRFWFLEELQSFLLCNSALHSADWVVNTVDGSTVRMES